MSPWDLIVWALALSVSLFIVGVVSAIVLVFINIARGKL